MALGILEHFDLAALPAGLGRQPAPADRGDEARLRRRLPLRQRPARRWTLAGAALLDPDYLAARARARSIRRARRISAPARRRRAGTVYLCAADARRNDGVADPVELHGLRLRRRRAGHRHQPAEPRRGLLARSPGTRTRSAAASVRSTRSFRASSPRDGAPLAAFGVMGGPIQPPGHVQTLVRLLDLRHEPAGRARRAAVEGRTAGCRRSRGDRRADELRARARRARPRDRRRSPIRTWTSAPASSSSARRRAATSPASDPRRDGQAAGF